MKKIFKIATGLALMALMVTSCKKDDGQQSGGGDQDVTITINAGTRGTQVAGIAADNEIQSLRLLGYASNGTLAFNVIARDTDFGTSGDGNKTASLQVKKGKYHLVFIANEDSDVLDGTHNAISTLLSNDSKVQTRTLLRMLKFGNKAFDKAKKVPMVTTYDDIEILGDDKVKVGATIHTNANRWKIAMDRVGVKVKFVLTLTQGQANQIKTATGGTTAWPIKVSNVPAECFLISGIDNSSLPKVDKTFKSTSIKQEGNSNDWTGTGNAVVTFEREILPELLFTPVKTEAKSTTLSLAIGSTTVTTKLGYIVGAGVTADSEDYTMPRNHYLQFTGTVKTDVEIDMTVKVVDWSSDEMNGSELS